MAAVSARNRDEWVSLFAEDAVVEDPVGPSMLDPDGAGHRGRSGIAAFFDTVSALYESISFDIHDSFECGCEVANVGTITIGLAGGQTGVVKGVFVYRLDPAGRIASLRAFWEPASMELVSGPAGSPERGGTRPAESRDA